MSLQYIHDDHDRELSRLEESTAVEMASSIRNIPGLDITAEQWAALWAEVRLIHTTTARVRDRMILWGYPSYMCPAEGT